MKVMIDTNIVISAVLFPNGKAAQAFYKALLPPYEPPGLYRLPKRNLRLRKRSAIQKTGRFYGQL